MSEDTIRSTMLEEHAPNATLKNNIAINDEVAKSKKDTFGETRNGKLEKRIEKLEHDLTLLKEEHFVLSEELSNGKDRPINTSDGSLSTTLQQEYDREMKRHIRQLKKYNELKDLGMGIIQLIADQKQSTLRGIMDEMGVEPDDK